MRLRVAADGCVLDDGGAPYSCDVITATSSVSVVWYHDIQ